MDFVVNILILAVVGYLLGSINSAILVSRLTMGYDIRTKGSGNAGLTNAYRCMGGCRTLLVLVGDVAKAAIALYIGGMLMGAMGKLIAGAFVILGHVFPLYFGFRGGKGVSVGAALGLMSGLPVLGAIMAIFFATAVISRKVSLGSMAAAAGLPIASWLAGAGTEMLIMNVFSALLVVFMHRSNISRLIKGTEPDFRPKNF